MLKCEPKLKNRLGNLEILDYQMLDSLKTVNNLKLFDSLEVQICLKIFDVNKWLAFSKQFGWLVGYGAFKIVKKLIRWPVLTALWLL